MFTDYVQVAVAEDHAVVADGGIPTRLSIADLASDDPTRLTPLEPPIAVMNQFLATVGDTIVLVGNRCDQGVKDLDIDYVCEPGTPFVYLFDPASAKWTSLLMISHSSGAGRRVAILDGPTKTWRVLDGRALALPSGAELTGLVHEPNRSRSWIDGQIWKTDPMTGRIRNTGVPGQPVANVRWSVPWGAGKVVALVGEREDPSSADRRMDLHLVVVDTANDAH